ncbi:hypothetical protein Landi51_04589 [Colletotrichum acutatum]
MRSDKTLYLFSKVHIAPNPPVVQAMVERMVAGFTFDNVGVVSSSITLNATRGALQHASRCKMSSGKAAIENPHSTPNATRGPDSEEGITCAEDADLKPAMGIVSCVLTHRAWHLCHAVDAGAVGHSQPSNLSDRYWSAGPQLVEQLLIPAPKF